MHGIKAGAYSESKYSNWTQFDPSDSAIDKIYWKHRDELERTPVEPKYFSEPTNPSFLMPISETDIREQLSKIPPEFTEGLEGIFVLGGNSKMNKVASGRLFRWGTYWFNCIFLFPYPKNRLTYHYKKSPKPSVLNDYRRVGAAIEKADKQGVTIRFDEEKLRNFYLRDVLVHEVGHHVERKLSKTHKKSEGFAEWFASEYGFRFQFFKE